MHALLIKTGAFQIGNIHVKVPPALEYFFAHKNDSNIYATIFLFIKQ